MKRFCRTAVVALIFSIGPSALLAQADNCRFQNVSEVKCIQMPVSTFVPLAKDAALPTDAHMVMNPPYYGLPAVDGFYRYYVIERHVYRVHPRTMKIIDHVGHADRRLW